jgi:hypothetical protein
MQRSVLIVGALLVVEFTWMLGCGSSLAPTSKANLTNAARLTERAYFYQDASSAAGALDRGAFCSIQAVLRDEKLGQIDSGVNCAP